MLQLLTSVSRMALLLLTLTPSSADLSVDSVFGNPEKSLLEAAVLLKVRRLKLGGFCSFVQNSMINSSRRLTHGYMPGWRGAGGVGVVHLVCHLHPLGLGAGREAAAARAALLHPRGRPQSES